MASIQTLERRIALLETRLSEVEGGYGETLYRLNRFRVKTDMTLQRIAERLDVTVPSEEEVDGALDAEE